MKDQKKQKIYRRIRNKFRLVVMNDDSFEQKFSMILSPLNVFMWSSAIISIIVVLTISVVSFTPIRQLIPGYSNIETKRMAAEASHKADSLMALSIRNQTYIDNIKTILNGDEPINYLNEEVDVDKQKAKKKITRSKADSLLRVQIEAEEKFNFSISDEKRESTQLFVKPITGIVSNPFNLKDKHFGIDLIGPKNEPIKAVLGGTVVFATWTTETGHVIQIQHANNLISVYKHNSVLFKKDGDVVKAGEAIAIIGESGELSSGPHLHFELWQKGQPVDPANYLNFE